MANICAVQLSPSTGTVTTEKGYITLPASYTKQNPSFSIEIAGFKPRFISPHPYTNQNTLTLARGPIIYCVEDVDNTSEKNHFKDITISANAAIKEEEKESLGEKFVGLCVQGGKRRLETWSTKESGLEPGSSTVPSPQGDEVDLVFIPYYFRANRGGNGNMRVGLIRSS